MKQIKLLLILLSFSFAASAQKYVGGDISLLTKYEQNGAKYFTNSGQKIDAMLPFFASEGLDAMRVRLFVDPTKATSAEKGEGVCQDIDFVKVLAKNIKDAGFKLMLDIHYSDTWADPAKQWTPEAWQSLSDDELADKVYDYTKDVLQQLKAAGATPDFIQTGNEISYGMLWGKRDTKSNRYYAGRADNSATRFFTFLKKARQACKEACPQAQTVLHIERSGQPDYAVNFFNDMKNNGVEYDIIGLSFYPYYHGNIATLETTVSRLEQGFPDKKIMIVETGYYHKWQPEKPNINFDWSSTYPITEAGQKMFTQALIEMLNGHANVNGLFWWFMEANEYGLDWNTKRVTDGWYNASLFDNETGKALSALSVLKDFLQGQSGVEAVETDQQFSNVLYDLQGRRVDADSFRGIGIRNGKVIIIR